MTNDIVIRPATAADTDAIGALAEATGLFPGALAPDLIAGYLDRSKPDLWLVAESGAGPVAFAFCEPERMTSGTWNLLAIAVAPERQGQGIGARLVKHLEGLLGAQGHRVLLVETLGTEAFARTRAFYHFNGYVEEARIRDFYEAGGDKVVFWKKL